MVAAIQTLEWGWPEIGTFLLANAVIFWICFPKVWLDIQKWRAAR
jgi:hypothetical protein